MMAIKCVGKEMENVDEMSTDTWQGTYYFDGCSILCHRGSVRSIQHFTFTRVGLYNSLSMGQTGSVDCQVHYITVISVSGKWKYGPYQGLPSARLDIAHTTSISLKLIR